MARGPASPQESGSPAPAAGLGHHGRQDSARRGGPGRLPGRVEQSNRRACCSKHPSVPVDSDVRHSHSDDLSVTWSNRTVTSPEGGGSTPAARTKLFLSPDKPDRQALPRTRADIGDVTDIRVGPLQMSRTP